MVAAIKVSVPVPAAGRSVAILDDTALAESMRKCVVWTCLLKGLLWKYSWRDTRDHRYLKNNMFSCPFAAQADKRSSPSTAVVQVWSQEHPFVWLAKALRREFAALQDMQNDEGKIVDLYLPRKNWAQLFYSRLWQAQASKDFHQLSARVLVLFGVWVSFSAWQVSFVVRCGFVLHAFTEGSDCLTLWNSSRWRVQSRATHFFLEPFFICWVRFKSMFRNWLVWCLFGPVKCIEVTPGAHWAIFCRPVFFSWEVFFWGVNSVFFFLLLLLVEVFVAFAACCSQVLLLLLFLPSALGFLCIFIVDSWSLKSQYTAKNNSARMTNGSTNNCPQGFSSPTFLPNFRRALGLGAVVQGVVQGEVAVAFKCFKLQIDCLPAQWFPTIAGGGCWSNVPCTCAQSLSTNLVLVYISIGTTFNNCQQAATTADSLMSIFFQCMYYTVIYCPSYIMSIIYVYVQIFLWNLCLHLQIRMQTCLQLIDFLVM